MILGFGVFHVLRDVEVLFSTAQNRLRDFVLALHSRFLCYKTC